MLPWYRRQQVIAIDFGPYCQCQTKTLSSGIGTQWGFFKNVIVYSNVLFPFLNCLAFVWDILKLTYRKAKGYYNPLTDNKPKEDVRTPEAAAPNLGSIKEL